jgi:O-antigen/teichoic acid export membrane protein
MTKNFELRDEVSILRGIFYGSTGLTARILFLFLANLFLARGLGPESYGIWSLTYIILSLGNAIILLGLHRGISRFIGKYRGSEESDRISATINTGLFLALSASFVISCALFYFARHVAILFKIPALSWLLKITAFTFIPTTVIEITGSIFQGYENNRVSRVINSFIPSFLWVVSVAVLMFTKRIDLINAAWVYLVLLWIAAGFALYFLTRHRSHIRLKITLNFISDSIKGMSKPLLLFSLPLLIFDLLTFISSYTDRFILGYFFGAYKVGIYDVASRIARLSPVLLLAVGDVFTPIASKMLMQNGNKKDDLNEFYFRVTKWSFIPTLIIVLTFMAFPDFFLCLFGKDFLGAAFVLQLLLIACLINGVAGPTEAMNIAVGSTGFVMLYTLFGALVSVVLNFLLIPKYGIVAAGMVSIISIVCIKAIAYIKLHRVDKISVFHGYYIQFVIISLIFGIGCGLGIHRFINSALPGIVCFLLTFALIAFFLLKKLQLLDQKDMELIARIRTLLGRLKQNLYAINESQ